MPAPYPTEVGTAITGAATSPATTEGNAPSIPATAITTLARRMRATVFKEPVEALQHRRRGHD